MGTGFPEGPQGFNVGRNVAVMAGLPVTVAGHDREPLLLVGPASRRDRGAHGRERGRRRGHRRRPRVDHDDAERLQQEQPLQPLAAWTTSKAIYMPMGLTAEIVAERYKVSREKQDELRARLAAAHRRGAEGGQVQGRDRPDDGRRWRSPTRRPAQKSQKEVTVDRDECNRPDTTLEGLAKLPPRLQAEGGSVTAGNSSQFSDGASAMPHHVGRAREGARHQAARLLPRLRGRRLRARRDGHRPGVRGAEAAQARTASRSTTSTSSS